MVNQLKPGIHLVRGNTAVKSLSLHDASAWGETIFGQNTDTPSAERIATAVSWEYVALEMRRQYVDQIDTEWTRNANPVDDEFFGFDISAEMPRIDTALQLYGVAYYHKERGRGNNIVRLTWKDPACMRPDINTQTLDGDYAWYIYTPSNASNSVSVAVPREDLIVIARKGLREAAPMSPAAMASSKAAQVVMGIESALDASFDAGGLPYSIVVVPPETATDEVNRIRQRFDRWFNRGLRRNEKRKTAAVAGNIDIKTISFSPDELAADKLDPLMADKILAVHGVPKALVYESANKADSNMQEARFVTSIGGRMRAIASLINRDEDVQRYGVEIAVYPDRHEALQRAFLEKAQGLMLLTGGRGVLTVEEARERLGMEPQPLIGELEPMMQPLALPSASKTWLQEMTESAWSNYP